MRRLVLGTDEELIERCARGDTGAFDILFKKYARPLTRFIERIVQNRERAEDLFQDTFIKVLENAERFDGRFRFTTWLYRIALNLSINELKKRRREAGLIRLSAPLDCPESSLDILDTFPSEDNPHRSAENSDLAERISKAVDRLPGPKKTAFMLKFNHNLSYEEIADILGCSKGTVKSRIHYAISELQVLAGE